MKLWRSWRRIWCPHGLVALRAWTIAVVVGVEWRGGGGMACRDLGSGRGCLRLLKEDLRGWAAGEMIVWGGGHAVGVDVVDVVVVVAAAYA